MQSDNQPLHTLLGLRQHWAPLLVPSLLRERSTCQDVDCCSQAAPKQDNNSADWAFMCYYITYMYINTHGARKRSEQRQSFDWGTTIRARCCRVKKFSFLWITKVWLIEIEFFPPPCPTSAWWVQGYQRTIGEKWRLEMLWPKFWKQCACHRDEVPQNQTASVVHSVHCTRYQNEELDLSQSGWNAWLVLLKLNTECESLENAHETPL